MRSLLRRVHSAAVEGFKADGVARYDTGRPSYSDECLQTVLNIVNEYPTLNRKTNIVELGSGTGKFTSSFINYFEGKYNMNSLNYMATEPSDGFRNALKKSIPATVRVEHGTGDSIPCSDDSIDAVVVAQAFHWMATESTLLEVKRILKKNSPLVMIWNSYDYSFDWLNKVEQEILADAYGADTPRQQNRKWERCFDTAVGKFFTPVKIWTGKQNHPGSRQLIVDRIFSTSVVAKMKDTEKNAVLMKLNKIIDSSPELAESRKSGTFLIPYITEVAWTRVIQ